MKKHSRARVIAIYLPQFHPIPENDEVWGKGFTEWTNVAQARPLFRGHYQPRIPADLGFYDLRMPEIREQQAELARNAGIEGFMYWQYYFGNNKKLLERPFEEVLHSGKPDYPFCLGWANHSWQTKTWKKDVSHREGKTMIMEQLYQGEQQYKDHFFYNLDAFKDHRYIKVDNKPLFVIWNPQDHPSEIEIFIKTWQQLAKENGLEGIHFIARQFSGSTKRDLIDMGFDAVYQERTKEAENSIDTFGTIRKIRNGLINYFGITTFLIKYDYEKIIKYLLNDESKDIDVYPTLLAGYDRSPRAGRKARIYYNFNPTNWSKHVKQVIDVVQNKPEDKRIVFLKSWNEWGESNYVEPDLKYGHQLLEELKNCLFEKV